MADAPVSAKRKVFDWTRDPPPSDLTPFQDFTRNVDWASSPLGPMHLWPSQLRQTVLLIVADPDPAAIYWGEPDSLGCVYNEAFAMLIGEKHPHLQGQDPAIGFAEIWARFDKVLRDSRERGVTRVGGRALLQLERYGFPEETYFSWKFVPMIDNDGYAVGSYVTVFEVTRDVVAERRTASIQTMNQHLGSAAELRDFWPQLLDGFRSAELDCPLVLLYSVDTDQDERPSTAARRRTPCILEGALGVPTGHACAPEHLDLERGSEGFESAMRETRKTGTIHLLQTKDGSLPARLLEDIEWRGYEAPCTEAVVCPVHSSSDHIAGFIIIGLNPMRPYDNDYRIYIEQITEQVARPYCSSLTLAKEVKREKDNAKHAAIERAELSSQLLKRTKEYEQSEMKFSRFADRSAVGLSIFNIEGEVLYANEAWYNFVGASAAESEEPMSWLDSVVPDDKSVVEHWWGKVVHGKQSGTFQVRSKKPFKGYSKRTGQMEADCSTGLCAAYPDLDDNGNVKTVMGLIMDISESKWIEDQVLLRTRQLEQNELQYRQFADHAPLGVCLVGSNGVMEFANDAWYSISTQSRKDKDLATWLEKTVHKEDAKKMEQFFADLRACKGPLTMESRLQKSIRIAGDDASPQIPAWVLASGYTELNVDGTFKNVVCWITDISAQKAAARELSNRMEEALELKRQQERFIDMISHEMRNPLSAVLHCSEEIIASSSQHNAKSEMAASLLGKGLSSCVPGSMTVEDLLRDITDAAKTISYCCQHQKRIVDDVLTLSKLDSALLVISPVAVQPMKVARDALQIFELELKAADIQFDLREDQSLKQLKMSWALLDPNRVHQVLINLLANAIKYTREQSRRQVTVKLAASRSRPMNYANGIEYLPGRTQRKNVANEPEENKPEQVYLSFSVTDTGRGLTKDEKRILFKGFSQGSPKTHVKYGGSGLGLFISRQITEMQGGEVGMASERGKGSTFTFYVKTEPASEPISYHRSSISSNIEGAHAAIDSASAAGSVFAANAPPLTDAIKNTAAPRRSLRILIVEDNLINQKVLSKQLRKRGFETDVANHGEEALEALTQGKVDNMEAGRPDYDLILLDIEMPVMGGLACVAQIRKMEAEATLPGHIPVIAVTANAREEHVKAAIDAGMDLVTTKPYRIEHLLSQIDLALEAVEAG